MRGSEWREVIPRGAAVIYEVGNKRLEDKNGARSRAVRAAFTVHKRDTLYLLRRPRKHRGATPFLRLRNPRFLPPPSTIIAPHNRILMSTCGGVLKMNRLRSSRAFSPVISISYKSSNLYAYSYIIRWRWSVKRHRNKDFIAEEVFLISSFIFQYPRRQVQL